MKWKHLFRPHILERGLDYCHEGAVEDLSVDDDTIRAVVYGSYDYEVEIYLENNEVCDMYCSCPHAEDGNNCKHMAAVLYEWEDYDASAKKPAMVDISELVNNADEGLVRRFLTDILSSNPALRNRFTILCSNAGSDFDMHGYKSVIENLISVHSDRDGYIDYYSASDFFNELDNLLYDDIEILLRSNRYSNAFELSLYLAQRVCELEMDDSDGGISQMFSRCYDIWNTVFQNVSKNEKECFFNALTGAASAAVADYAQDFFEDFFVDKLNDPDFSSAKIKYLENQIDMLINSENSYSTYQLQKLLLQRLELMVDEKCDRNLQLDFCRKYWQYSGIRMWYIANCIEHKDYDIAIETLLESIELDGDYRGTVFSHKKQLKDLYKITGRHEAYLKLLREVVISGGGSNLDLYLELKQQYAEEEWLRMRDDILDSISPHTVHILYNAEKMYSKLLECAMNCDGLYLMEQYKNTLLKLFPTQVLDKYTNELNKMASYTSDRKQYKNLVDILRAVQKFPGGKERAAVIVSDWRERYKRRSAMMDELSKLK